MTGFAPQLLGETEKTLNALLGRVLADTGLTEPEWVTLRLAGQNHDRADLPTLVSDRTHFAEASEIVAGLTDRGLVAAPGLTGTGEALVQEIQARIAALTAPIWSGLPADDLAAAGRILQTVRDRARLVLAEA